MQLLVQVKVKFTSDSFVLAIKAISDNFELLSQILELSIVIWLHNEVVILELVEVERILHHFRVFGQGSGIFLKMDDRYKATEVIKRSHKP